MTTATHLATAKEVAAAIVSLGYQASSETLGAISRNCRDQFLSHLTNCITDNDPGAVSAKVVDGLLRGLSPDSVNKLKAVVPDATIDMIVPVALKAPAKFLSALEAASDASHARHADAKAFLTATFVAAPPAEADEPAPAPTSTAPAAPPPRAQNSGPPTTPAAAGDAKAYKSVHVYGGSYALCFNAGEWEGKPGIMVDAAVSSGPKTYDWKNAAHIWLNVNEIGAVLAVFRRWRKGVEFSAHGAQNDKAFSIEFQGQHFYAKVVAKKANEHPTRAVKILPTDATAVSILFLTQLASAYPAIPMGELLATVRATHQLQDASAA